MNLERLNKLRLLSALSGRFKDLEVLREEKLTKNAPKNGKLALLRQCHFLEQSNLLFSKYFKQIFSSPEDQIGDAFYFEAFQIENIRSDKYEGICFYICRTNHQTGGECLRCASLLRVANGAAAVRIPGRSPVPSP